MPLDLQRAAAPGRGAGKDQLVLIDVAERHEARQERCLDVKHVQEVDRAQAGRRAARRQVERGARKAERSRSRGRILPTSRPLPQRRNERRGQEQTPKTEW